ncbi:MAG: maleate cis-trans isomerase [Candidatus Bathyarchaeota archaeon]|nr:maleate cis-trans isomerase [Candidatus Bathyarchaeota archaeon]
MQGTSFVMQRLGVIVPSSNITVEVEFTAALWGSQISLHTARIPLREVTVQALSAMEKETEAAARLLKDADVNAVAFACTSGSLIKGLGHDAVIAQKISKIAACPVVVTSHAVVEALKEVDAHRIALATPYVDEVNKREVDFLEKSGFEIVNLQAFNLKSNLDIGRLTADDAAVLARSADSTVSDALFVSCTNLATFEMLSGLEGELHKPVVSSNSATLWASLRALNSSFRPRLGRLLEVFRFHS